MLWDKFSDRKKGMIDALAFILFFLPTMAVLFFISVDDMIYAFRSTKNRIRALGRQFSGRAAPSFRHRLHAVPARDLGADEEPVGLEDRRVPNEAGKIEV